MGLYVDDRLREESSPISSDDGSKLISGDFSDVVFEYYPQIALEGRGVLQTLLELEGQLAITNIFTSGMTPGELWPIGSFLWGFLFLFSIPAILHKKSTAL